MLGFFRALLSPTLTFIASMAVAVLFVLLAIALAPGSAADIVANSSELRDGLTEHWGLDDPFFTRYFRFISALLHGDLGQSLTYRAGEPIVDLVARSAPATMFLVFAALAASISSTFCLAWFTAGRKSISRSILRALSVAPVFLAAYLSMVIADSWAFHTTLQVGIQPPEWFPLLLNDSNVKVALAVFVLGMGSSAGSEIHSNIESALVEIRRSGYIDAARSRGAKLWPHILRNVAAPLAALTAARVPYFLGGVIVVEKVLHLNGVGAMLWEACRLRDFPLALGITVLSAAVVCSARLIADLIRVAIDPRLRGSK